MSKEIHHECHEFKIIIINYLYIGIYTCVLEYIHLYLLYIVIKLTLNKYTYYYNI